MNDSHELYCTSGLDCSYSQPLVVGGAITGDGRMTTAELPVRFRNISKTNAAWLLMNHMMKEDGLVLPPDLGAFQAALDWWDGLEESERDCWKAIGLETIRHWWTCHDRWLKEQQSFDPEMCCVHWVFEFEHAFVYGGMDSRQWWMKKRGSGSIKSIRVATKEDPWDPWCCLVEHKNSSPWRQKWVQRDLLKKKLPGRLRTCVNQARSNMPFKRFKRNCEGGEFIGNWSEVGRVSERKAAQMLMAMYRQKEQRIKDLRFSDDFDLIEGRIVGDYEPEERWSEMARILMKKMNWDLKQLWRHIQGKDVLPEDVLFAPQPIQMTLFSEEE